MQATVIMYYPENNQVVSDHVEAASLLQAFYVAAESRCGALAICSLPGHLTEGQNTIEFPGMSGAVDVDTILAQPEVFNPESQPSTANRRAKHCETASRYGYTIQARGHGHYTFLQSYRKVWGVGGGWMTADCIKGEYINHKGFDNLSDALDRPL
jgi:hypothetical protein